MSESAWRIVKPCVREILIDHDAPTAAMSCSGIIAIAATDLREDRRVLSLGWWHAEPHPDGDLLVPRDSPADFALRVEGDSMAGAGILSGDLVICRSTASAPAQAGDIVVALLQGEEATIKYLVHEGGQWKLRAAHARYPDRVISAADDPVIQAVVVSIQSDPQNRKPPDLRELVEQSELVDLQGLTPDQRRLIRQTIRQFKRQGESGEELPDDFPF